MSVRCDDNKDSLNEIPFPSQDTLVTSHECKLVGPEPNSYQNKVLFTKKVIGYDSRSHQNKTTKGQVAEMTKSWLPVTHLHRRDLTSAKMKPVVQHLILSTPKAHSSQRSFVPHDEARCEIVRPCKL